METGKFKTKRVYFAQVSNHALRDRNLSLKAKGLYSLIQSLITDPRYDLYKSSLQKMVPEGTRAFDSAWKELKTTGYLLVDKQHTKGGFVYEYELLEKPEDNSLDVNSPGVQNVGVGKVSVDNAAMGNLSIENPTPTKDVSIINSTNSFNTKNNNNTEYNNQSIHQFPIEEIIYNSISDHQYNYDDFVAYASNIIESTKLKNINSHTNNIESLVNEIIHCMADVFIDNSPKIRIDGSNYQTTKIVKQKFQKINFKIALGIIDALNTNNIEIKNPKAYMIKTLYSSLYSNGGFAASHTKLPDPSDFE